MNRRSIYGSFLPHTAGFVPLPPVCSILILILLPYCPIHLPGFMFFPYMFYPNPDSLHSQLLPLLLSLVLIQAFIFFYFDFMPTFLPFCPTCLQSQSPLFNLSVFILTCHFLLSFFWLVCLYLHPGSLPHFSSSLSLHLFHAVSSKFQLFIYALFYYTHTHPTPSMLSTLLLVLFPQPTFSNLFHFADHRWLWSPFLCTQIGGKKISS